VGPWAMGDVAAELRALVAELAGAAAHYCTSPLFSLSSAVSLSRSHLLHLTV